MSNTTSNTSDSNEDISLYETPITSPLNESLIYSTQIDSELFGSNSANSRAMDLMDIERQLDMTSPATDSTLRQTIRQLNSDFGGSSHQSIPETSVWFRRHLVSRFAANPVADECTDRYTMLMKCFAELDEQNLELIGVEQLMIGVVQQIQSLSLKCRAIRENIGLKTDSIHEIINGLISNPKQTAQKQTQTDLKDPEVLETKPIAAKRHQNLSSNHSLISNKPMTRTAEKWTETHVKTPLSVSLRDNENTKKFKFCFKSKVLSNNEFINNRFGALVKGYLTRRLMKTTKVMNIIETIRATTQLLIGYHNSPPYKKITPEDLNLHKQLMTQLSSRMHAFYDIFFNYPKSAQMALISQSREAIIDRQFRTGSVLSNISHLTTNLNTSHSQTIRLSSVTQRTCERKAQTSRPILNVNTPSTSQIPKSSPSSTFTARMSTPRVTVGKGFTARGTASRVTVAKSSTAKSVTAKESTDSLSEPIRRSQRTAKSAANLKRKATFNKK